MTGYGQWLGKKQHDRSARNLGKFTKVGRSAYHACFARSPLTLQSFLFELQRKTRWFWVSVNLPVDRRSINWPGPDLRKISLKLMSPQFQNSHGREERSSRRSSFRHSLGSWHSLLHKEGIAMWRPRSMILCKLASDEAECRDKKIAMDSTDDAWHLSASDDSTPQLMNRILSFKDLSWGGDLSLRIVSPVFSGAGTVIYRLWL